MIADYLHSFYRMPVNLVIGGVPTVCTLRWFKAPAGAQRLPFPSAIFSHVWDNNPGESVPGEIGELGTPRTWDPGNNVGYQGQCYRGDPSWFATGNLPPLASIAPSPCLCVIPPAVGSGTLVLGGAASGSAPPVCQVWANRTPQLDLLDGNGPQPMIVHVAGISYYLPVPNASPYIWIAARHVLACHGQPNRWVLSLGITPSFTIVNDCVLGQNVAPFTVGNWFNQATSVVEPNKPLVLYS